MQDEIDKFHQSGHHEACIPLYVVLNEFSDRIVTRVRRSEVYSIMLHIERLVFCDAEHYPKPLVEACAIVDWLADTRNGSLDQYFARQERRSTRRQSFSFVLSGLERIGHNAGAELFREAVAIYSHFFNEIEIARCSLGITPVRRVEESDILARFFEMHKEIESSLAAYFVDHPLEFAVPKWRRAWYRT